jgi:iron uptake system component EfeO
MNTLLRRAISRMKPLCAPILGLLVMGAGPSNADTSPLDAAAERYRSYMIEDIGHALTGARAMRNFIGSNDLGGAKQAWIDSRVGWERSEVFTSGFVPELDEQIDAWPNADHGFHGIEARLFGAGLTDAGDETDRLIAHLSDLDTQIHSVDLPPQRLLNGIARLAFEVGGSKTDGGESRLSGTSLNDMRSNVDGIKLAYETIFASAIEAHDPRLAGAAQEAIRRLKAQLDVASLTKVDPDKLRVTSEDLVAVLQSAAPKIGLAKPTLEETGK